jgi:hypothetical protein
MSLALSLPLSVLKERKISIGEKKRKLDNTVMSQVSAFPEFSLLSSSLRSLCHYASWTLGIGSRIIYLFNQKALLYSAAKTDYDALTTAIPK